MFNDNINVINSSVAASTIYIYTYKHIPFKTTKKKCIVWTSKLITIKILNITCRQGIIIKQNKIAIEH